MIGWTVSVLVALSDLTYAAAVSTPSTSLADTPVTALKGVGPKSAERLHKLGIRSVQDLLFHLPIRYQDRTRIVPIGSLRAGDQAVIQGEVELADIRFGRRRCCCVYCSFSSKAADNVDALFCDC